MEIIDVFSLNKMLNEEQLSILGNAHVHLW